MDFQNAFKAISTLVCCVALFSVIDAQAVTLSRLNGEPIPIKSLDQVLVEDWVIVNAEIGKNVKILGSPLNIPKGTQAVLGTTSTMLFALVVKGMVYTRKEMAEPGEVLVISHNGGQEVADIDAEGFQRRLKTLGAKALADDMAPIIARQKRLKFWGLLRPTGVNLTKRFNVIFEEGRSRYLLRPALIKLQKRYPDHTERAKQTVRLFLNALLKQDADLTADLLNPNNFMRDKSRPLFSSDEWVRLREKYAQKLTAVPRVVGSKVSEPVMTNDKQVGFKVSIDLKNYLMTIMSLEGTFFVNSLKLDESRP
jgi:hypothetical protein